MSSPRSKKSKKEKRSKFEDADDDANEPEAGQVFHDNSLPPAPSNKRKGIDMSRFSSEVGDADGSDPHKKIRVSMNPWTNRPYSKRYYEILKTRESLPAWEAKR